MFPPLLLSKLRLRCINSDAQDHSEQGSLQYTDYTVYINILLPIYSNLKEMCVEKTTKPLNWHISL